jgi:zinc/manganese transport system substrate-binding protein
VHAKDPHWWHSIDHFRRAVTVVTTELTKALPEHAEQFQKNADTYRVELNNLERWAKREIAKIPRDRRHLATAHAAFNYFCKDFGFTAHPLQGLNREQTPDPAALAALIKTLQDEHVAAIFPETASNPKILKILTQDTGIRLGEPLNADGTAAESYAAMYRHNVNAIVRALGN